MKWKEVPPLSEALKQSLADAIEEDEEARAQPQTGELRLIVNGNQKDAFCIPPDAEMAVVTNFESDSRIFAIYSVQPHTRRQVPLKAFLLALSDDDTESVMDLGNGRKLLIKFEENIIPAAKDKPWLDEERTLQATILHIPSPTIKKQIEGQSR